MSATLPNISVLSDWLKAALYITEFRPVPLKQMLKIGSKIYDDQMNVIRVLGNSNNNAKNNNSKQGASLELSQGGGLSQTPSKKGFCFSFRNTGVCHKASSCTYRHEKPTPVVAPVELVKLECKHSGSASSNSDKKSDSGHSGSRSNGNTESSSNSSGSGRSGSSSSSGSSGSNSGSSNSGGSSNSSGDSEKGDTKTYSNRDDPEHLAELCQEVTIHGHSVLIFCPTKHWCEQCASILATSFKTSREKSFTKASDLIGSSSNIPSTVAATGLLGLEENNAALDQQQRIAARQAEREINRAKLVEELRQLPDGLSEVLKLSVPEGIAFHHAGLTTEERSLIENAFRVGTLNILVATSTLAAGVNLPARRVIFRTCTIAGQVLDRSRYQQMSGRAGRAGKDEVGESILIAEERYRTTVAALVKPGAPLAPISSCLTQERRGLNRAILDMVASGVVKSVEEAHTFVGLTLLPFEQTDQTTVTNIESSITFLMQHEFLETPIVKKTPVTATTTTTASPIAIATVPLPIGLVQQTEEKDKPLEGLSKTLPLHSTLLGMATFASGLCPEEALIEFSELSKARRGLVLQTELHLCYHLTPVYQLVKPPWTLYLSMYSNMSTGQKNVADKVGVTMEYLARSAQKPPKHATVHDSLFLVHSRFYMALMLEQLVNETPLASVENRFAVPRGELQSLMTNSATFAGMVAVFCERLHWRTLALLILHMRERLNFGVQPELLDLMRIPGVKAKRARSLFDAGLATAEEVAQAKPAAILQALRRSTPFSSLNDADDSLRVVEERNASVISRNARRLIGDLARGMQLETDAIVVPTH